MGVSLLLTFFHHLHDLVVFEKAFFQLSKFSKQLDVPSLCCSVKRSQKHLPAIADTRGKTRHPGWTFRLLIHQLNPALGDVRNTLAGSIGKKLEALFDDTTRQTLRLKKTISTDQMKTFLIFMLLIAEWLQKKGDSEWLQKLQEQQPEVRDEDNNDQGQDADAPEVKFIDVVAIEKQIGLKDIEGAIVVYNPTLHSLSMCTPQAQTKLLACKSLARSGQSLVELTGKPVSKFGPVIPRFCEYAAITTTSAFTVIILVGSFVGATETNSAVVLFFLILAEG